MKWDTFIASKSGRRQPLPPIPSKSSQGGSSTTFVTEPDHQPKHKPVPSIRDAQQPIDKNLLKGKPIIFVGGGPGLNCNESQLKDDFFLDREWQRNTMRKNH